MRTLSMLPKVSRARAPRAAAPRVLEPVAGELVVLGVDPGTQLHGYAVVHFRGGRALVSQFGRLDVSGLADVVRALPQDAVVGIETSLGVHPGIARQRGAKAALSIAAASAPTTRADGVLEGLAVARGLRVARCTAIAWRKALVGRGQASDAEISQVVPRLVESGHLLANAHQRDATGVALFVGRRELLARRAG